MSFLAQNWGRLRRYGILAGIWTVTATLGSKVQTLVALAVIGYTQGVVAGGAFGVATGVALLSATVADFGFSSFVTRAVAGGEVVGRSAIVRPGLIRVVVAGPLAAMLSATLLRDGETPKWALAIAVGAYAAGYVASTIALRAAYGAHSFRKGATINGSVRAITIVPMLVGGSSFGSPVYLVSIMAMGEVVIAVWQYLAIPKRLGAEADAIVLTFRSSWRLGIATIANVIANRSDVVVVSLFGAAIALGEYNVASQVENALTVAALIPAGATVAFVARAHKSGDPSSPRLVWAVSFAVVLTYTLGAVPFLVIPETLVPALFGVGVSDYSVVRLCVVAGYFSALAAVQLQVLIGLDRQSVVMGVWLVLVPVAVAALGVGMTLAGATGAGWGALVRDICFFALTIGVARVLDRRSRALR